MKMEFKNGSSIETIENTGVNTRSKKKMLEMQIIEELDLFWYQKLYLKYLIKKNGLFTWLRRLIFR